MSVSSSFKICNWSACASAAARIVPRSFTKSTGAQNFTRSLIPRQYSPHPLIACTKRSNAWILGSFDGRQKHWDTIQKQKLVTGQINKHLFKLWVSSGILKIWLVAIIVARSEEHTSELQSP